MDLVDLPGKRISGIRAWRRLSVVACLRLQLGGYNTVDFFRVDKGFVAQFAVPPSSPLPACLVNRHPPLTPLLLCYQPCGQGCLERQGATGDWCTSPL